MVSEMKPFKIAKHNFKETVQDEQGRQYTETGERQRLSAQGQLCNPTAVFAASD